jgi:superfamily II DNA helicase RecQ
MRRDKLFIVVVPYTALLADLVTRALEKGLRAREWEPTDRDDPDTGLVFVGCRLAASKPFKAWAMQQASVHETLRMVVFEEAHVPLISADYRPEMTRLHSLRTLPVPVMLLSGTVPPSLVPNLEAFYGCTKLHVFRDLCDRPNLKYQVKNWPRYTRVSGYQAHN